MRPCRECWQRAAGPRSAYCTKCQWGRELASAPPAIQQLSRLQFEPIRALVPMLSREVLIAGEPLRTTGWRTKQ